MWFAVVVIMFLGSDGRVHEREFRSERRFESATECLQTAGGAVTQSLHLDERIRGYVVVCAEEPTV